MTLTATCADCDIGWRGPGAFALGEQHERDAGHVVWYDNDPDTFEDETTGPFTITWAD